MTNQKLENRFSIAELIGSAAGGLTGGQLPDIFDPPVSPNHRELGHSMIAASAGVAIAQKAISTLKASQNQLQIRADSYTQNGYDIPVEIRQKLALNRLWTGFLMGLCAGYISHLALDSKTPAGINW